MIKDVFQANPLRLAKDTQQKSPGIVTQMEKKKHYLCIYD